MEEDWAFECVRCLTLVEASLAAPAQCRIGVLFGHEERPLDAAEFSKSLASRLSLGDAESFLEERTMARMVIDAAS
jgi:hypothetical protein